MHTCPRIRLIRVAQPRLNYGVRLQPVGSGNTSWTEQVRYGNPELYLTAAEGFGAQTLRTNDRPTRGRSRRSSAAHLRFAVAAGARAATPLSGGAFRRPHLLAAVLRPAGPSARPCGGS